MRFCASYFGILISAKQVVDSASNRQPNRTQNVPVARNTEDKLPTIDESNPVCNLQLNYTLESRPQP